MLGLVTAAGLFFHMHSSLARLPYTWLPWSLAWIAVAASYQLLHGDEPPRWRSLPRVAWAALLTAPLAALLRAWLQGGEAVLPLFVLIMGALTALALLAWRALYIGWISRHG